MAYAVKDGGYTYDDLDWLRDELGVAHLELDPWGSLIHRRPTNTRSRPRCCMHRRYRSWRGPMGASRQRVRMGGPRRERPDLHS
jgi:hypothetical protein